MNLLRDNVNIVGLLGFCEQPPVLLIKYYPLGSLEGFLQKGLSGYRYSTPVKFNLAHGIARGLVFIHGNNIAHCDIKSPNVLLEPTRSRFAREPLLRAVISDFGVCRILTAKSEMHNKAFEIKNVNAVSLKYAAPETLTAFRNKVLLPPVIALKGDVYSFGAVLYELVTIRMMWSK